MKNKLYAVLNAVMLILTITVNYLSNMGFLNGNTMKTVSDAYFTRFTPAGYAFSIWGLIYLGLLCFVVRSLVNVFKGKDPLFAVQRIAWWFALSCLCNMLWVVAWLSHYTLLSVLLMAILLIALLRIVVGLRLSMNKLALLNYIFIALPFSLYAGWVSLAIIANVAALLVKINWDGFGLTEATWAIIMVSIAGLLNVFMVLKRNMRAFGAVGIWGLLAVAAGQRAEDPSILWTCYVLVLIILLSIVYNCFRPSFSPTERQIV